MKNKRFISFLTVLAIAIGFFGYLPKNNVVAASQADAIVAIAQAESGYAAGSSGYNKYGQWWYDNFDDNSYYQTCAWCAIFISWCARQAGIPTNVIKNNVSAANMESTPIIGNFGGKYYPKGSITPQKGDIVYYDWNGVDGSDHVELVIDNGKTSLGGNTRFDLYSNGGVGTHSLSANWGDVIGFERPNYGDVPPEPEWIFDVNNAPKCSSTYWLGRGTVGGVTGTTTGDDVKWLQTALNKTINAGLTVDGILGSGTETAIKNFQEKYGLTADGYAGKNTINKLVELLSPSTSLAVPVASLQYATPKTLTFNWNAVSGATSYKITFRKSGDEYAVKEENFKGTSYTITGLNPNTQYYFRVYAKNSSTTSARSETVGGKTPANVDVGTDFFAYIVHAKSGKVIDRDDNNNVILMKKNPNCMAQIWRFVKQSDGSYVIYNGQNKEFKGVLDSTNTNKSGANVYVYDSFVKTSNAQYWYIFNTGNAYSFYTKSTDCTMDLNNYNETDGTNIGMGTYFGNTAQQYKIEKVSCTHNYGSWTTSKAATCTTDGTQTRKCSICGNTESKTIIKTGHSLGDWTTSKNATCTADGTQVRKCSKCNYSESKTIAKTGHSLGDWTTSKNATCTADGTQIRKCSKCSYSESKTITKTGHSLGNWTTSKNATCTADGTQVRKCSKCSYSEEKAIAKTGHKYTDKIVAPSCTENGYTLHTCSSCNDSYKDKETNAKGHTFTSKMFGSYMTYICSDCGYIYTAPFEGEGTAESPFIISNADELRAVSETVNSTEINQIFGHAYYKQTADIDLENISWTPIGLGYDGEDGRGTYNCNTRMFFGVYDGNQRTIYNLNVENHIAAGLFGCVRNDRAEVCNLVVYGNINSDSDSGGITGGLHYGAKITNCAFIGDVKGNLSLGGISGYTNGGAIISNCYHNGEITGGNETAGIVGNVAFNKWADNNAATIVENCYHSNGEVTGKKCGAIVGNCVYFEEKNNTITIKNCYASKSSNYNERNETATYDDTMILPDSMLKKIAEDLGEAYADNTNSELNNGFPVFPWQLDIMLKGDADNNGVVDVDDAIMLQEWLLGASKELTNWENVDLCEDGRIDVFDLCLLKRLLTE